MSLRDGQDQLVSSVSTAMAFTDEDLVAAYQADPLGSSGRQAVSRLLGRYRRLVLVWCGRYVRDRDGALDLAQDVLLSAFRNLATYQDHQKFSAWLFIITRNRCLSELRKRSIPLAEGAVLEFVADTTPGPEVHFEEKLAVDSLRRLVTATLTQEEKDALWMRCFEALPVEVITSQLGIVEPSGARGVLQRARRKLRRALADEGSGRLKGES